MIPARLKKQFQGDKFYNKCCYTGCSRPPQFHHVFQYAGKSIQEDWAILPACKFHHDQATPHKNQYKQEVREYFEIISLEKMPIEAMGKYPKNSWSQLAFYLNKKYERDTNTKHNT